MQKVLNKKYLQLITNIFMLMFLCISTNAQAVTGDTLATSLLTDTPGAYGTRTIVTGTANGCYSNTGSCVKMDCTTGTCPGTDLWTVDIPDTNEITIVWYEKYDVYPLTWTEGGCKSIRPFNGTDSIDYLGTLITFYGTTDLYSNIATGGTSATLIPTAVVGSVSTATDYCTDNGNGTYSCPHGRFKLYAWNVGGVEGMGTNWRKMRIYIKVPSIVGSTDGITTLWVDDEEVYTVQDFNRANGGPNIIYVNFAPVDQSGTAHGHWYDDITIYEWRVSPSGVDTVAPSSPSGLSVN